MLWIMCANSSMNKTRSLRCVLCTNRYSSVLKALQAADGVDLVGVVHPLEPRKNVEYLMQEIPEYIPRIIYQRDRDSNTVTRIKALRPDLLITCSFQYVLPDEYLSMCAGINLHPSMLPLYPGLNPWIEQYKDRVKSGGYTVHILDRIADAGEILGQAAFPWPSHIDNLERFADQMMRQYGVPLLLRTISSM